MEEAKYSIECMCVCVHEFIVSIVHNEHVCNYHNILTLLANAVAIISRMEFVVAIEYKCELWLACVATRRDRLCMCLWVVYELNSHQ